MTLTKNSVLKTVSAIFIISVFFTIVFPILVNSPFLSEFKNRKCASANFYDAFTVSASNLLAYMPPPPTHVSLGISKTASYANRITLCLTLSDKDRENHNVRVKFQLPEGIKVQKGKLSPKFIFNTEATYTLEIELLEPSRYVIGVVANEGTGIFGAGEIVLDYKDGQITYYGEWGRGWSEDSWKTAPANSLKLSQDELPKPLTSLRWTQLEKTDDIWYATKNRELVRSKGYSSKSEPFTEVTDEQRIDFMKYYNQWFKNNGWEKLYAKKSSALTWGSYEEEEYIYVKNNYYVNFGVKYTLYGKSERTYQFFINHS